jgi:DNA polymerase-3 subunit delta'
MASFSSVVGQHFAKKRLEPLLLGNPDQAYVLSGPPGIGKTRLARAMAKALLCASPNTNGSCDHCGPCRYFEEKTHPDYIELEPASGEKIIRVSKVREKVVFDGRLFPQISKRKVYVIDADLLNEEGQNSLLKTLEEPPRFAVFILTVSDTEKLLKTILSRSVVIALHPNSEQEVKDILIAELGLEPGQAAFFAGFSNGIPGNAIKLASEGHLAESRDYIYELIIVMPGESRTSLLTDRYEYMESNKDQIEEILSTIQMVLGDMSRLISDQSVRSLRGEDKRDKMVETICAEQITQERIKNASDAVTTVSRALKGNCSFETAICRMLLTIKKELTNA